MHDADANHRQAVALFRYGLIADLVRLEPGAKGLYASSSRKRPATTLSPAAPARGWPPRRSGIGSSVTARAASRR
jgi:hypothetical protein